MLSHIKDIVKESRRVGYAVGSYNVHNFETALGIARAAKKAKSPAIIQVSESTIKYMGLKPVTHIVSTLAKNLATDVPIALHLDHGSSIESIILCIEAGFTSVHIDASSLPLDENIAITKQVVEFAHARNVWVQGEIAVIVGGHGESGQEIKIPLANPDDVEKFTAETKVDTIAAGVGTAHGIFANETIVFDLLRDIKKRTNIPFVLHGGSGLDDEIMKQGIIEGVDIINIGTDIKLAFSRTLIDICLKNQHETDPRKLLIPTIEAVEAVVMKKMELFGSANQVNNQFVGEI
jgi:fructose-bisphosphate aldolase, class II